MKPIGLITDVLFLAYAGLTLFWIVRMCFWEDLRSWWRNYQARRREIEQLNKLWEQGGFD